MDILLGNSGVSFISGELDLSFSRIDNVTQRLFMALRTYKGAWFLDQSYGIDWVRAVFGKNRLKSTVDTFVIDTILNDKYVGSLISFNSRITTDREYLAEFRVKIKSADLSLVSFRLLANERGLILSDDNNNQFTL